MKIFYLLTLSLVVLLSGCDIIDEPYMNPVDDDPNNGETVQKVLLEEFTGHQCPNCPTGAQTASQLHDFYGDKFIIVAYHAGWFARTSPQYPTDYRTAIGEELNTYFQVVAYPSGMINRTTLNSNLLLNPTDWSTATSAILSEDPRVCLTITKVYVQESRNLSVSVNVRSLTINNSMKVCVYITEDNLISPQKTSVSETYPEGIIYDYVHNHVFRTSLNGTWGTEVFADGSASGDTELIDVNSILSAEWDVNNLNIVCFAYDPTSGEILQAETIEVI